MIMRLSFSVAISILGSDTAYGIVNVIPRCLPGFHV